LVAMLIRGIGGRQLFTHLAVPGADVTNCSNRSL